MAKNLQRYREDNIRFSFDSAAFTQATIKAMADVASGRITPAEGRRLAAEAGRTLKLVESAIKLGKAASRLSNG